MATTRPTISAPDNPPRPDRGMSESHRPGPAAGHRLPPFLPAPSKRCPAGGSCADAIGRSGNQAACRTQIALWSTLRLLDVVKLSVEVRQFGCQSMLTLE